MRTIAHHKGFSLIELMVTLTIIGALAAIAIPNYGRYVTNTRITEALGQLAASRITMEQFFQANRTYAGAGVACGQNVATFNTSHFAFSCTVDTDADGAADPGEFRVTVGNIANVGLGAANAYSYTINQVGTQQTTAYPGVAGGALPPKIRAVPMTKAKPSSVMNPPPIPV